MINHDFQAESLFNSLALHRFYIHMDEVKRALRPILEEVYLSGYVNGVADRSNNLHDQPEMPAVKPTSNEEVNVEEESHADTSAE